MIGHVPDYPVASWPFQEDFQLWYEMFVHIFSCETIETLKKEYLRSLRVEKFIIESINNDVQSTFNPISSKNSKNV